MKKVYRIFISSCKRLLEKERQILTEVILMNDHLPVQMEYNFKGGNTDYSIEIDKKKIEESDCVIFILSYLYGEIIGKKVGDKDKCPFKESKHRNCDSCFDPIECKLSFTQFEYEYAKLLDKPIVVIYNKNYDNDEAFSKANLLYIEKNKCYDCTSVYYESKRKNIFFVSEVASKHAFPYSDHKDFFVASMSAVRSAEDMLKIRENNGATNQGLVPYAQFSELDRKSERIKLLLNTIQEKGIETIYDSQSSALEELAKEEDIYEGINGDNSVIKVLAIRGASFTGGMGHEWTRFILDEEFKDGRRIDVEFILGNYKNETLIEERYKAFLPFKVTNVTLQKYKDDYINDMKRAQDKIKEYSSKYPCRLYLHNEARLPFRMIFIGKYLYFSTFLNSVKAADAPVMKIPFTSTLYKVCEEYYQWIKSNSEEQL